MGEVTGSAINFPVALGIAPINDLLADVFGSEVAAVGLLSGNWTISLGGKILAVSSDKGLKNTNSPIDQLLDGVPLLASKGPHQHQCQPGPDQHQLPRNRKTNRLGLRSGRSDALFESRGAKPRPSSRRWRSRCTVCWNTHRWTRPRRNSKWK